MIKVSQLDKWEINPVGTSKGGTASLWDLMLLYTQRQGPNPRQLIKGEWVLANQPYLSVVTQPYTEVNALLN